MSDHISFTRVDMWKLLRVKCPECELRTRQLATYQEWYGWRITCLACGDQWSDGVLMPRPFMRGWRGAAVSAAEKQLAALRRMARLGLVPRPLAHTHG